MEAHEIPMAVQWHEGMLLSPHHFQQSSLRQEGLVHYHASLASPYGWGVRRLRFDPVLLPNGTLRVLELEALMPDGLVVWHQAGGAAELTIDLKPHMEGRASGSLTVQLAVPAQRAPAEPFAGTLARWASAEGDPVHDENTGDNPIAVPRLVPRVALIVADTAPEKYTAFPLARIDMRGEVFALGSFLPPQLQVEPHSELGALCGQFARRLREKAVYISEKVRASAALSTNTHITDLEHMMEQFVAGLPQLEALLASGRVHPFQLYLSLCGIAGQVSTIGLAVVPPPFRRYDQNDLRASFEPVLEFCNRMLDQVHESYSIVPFMADDSAFRIALRPEWAKTSLIIGVAGRGATDTQELAAWIESSCIGTETRMPSIRERRIRGADRTRIESADELSLIPARGVLLYRVQVDPAFIEPGAVLQIVNPGAHAGAPRPQEIVLYTAN